MYSYTIEDLINALKESGLKKGDVVLLYSSMSTLGLPKDIKSQDDLCALCLDAFNVVIGEEGTLAIPTYTYSLGNSDVYDPISTPCPQLGPLAEYFRKFPNVRRSLDPFLSVAVQGPKSSVLIDNLSSSSYGKGSFFERLVENEGKIVCLGLDLHWATFRHYSEEIANVPFRYKKCFTGHIIKNGKKEKCSWIYSVRQYIQNANPSGMELAKKALEAGLIQHTNVGRGYINTIDAQAYFAFSLQEFKKNPWISARGPACDLIQEEEKRVGKEVFELALPQTPSLEDLARALTPLPRNIISDAYDTSLDILAQQFLMQKYSYVSGTEAYGYIVPEKWTCHDVQLQYQDGKKIFSLADSSFHIATYSAPFSGTLDKKVLFENMIIEKNIPNAIPFAQQEYTKTWSLCCSLVQKQNLQDDMYTLLIDSDFSYGKLKIGEVIVRGNSDKHIVIATTLAGAGQFNKGLSGVIGGLALSKKLQSKESLYYTYHILIVPEIEALSCWFADNKDILHTIYGVLHLDMLATQDSFIMLHNKTETKFAKDIKISMKKNGIFFMETENNEEQGWTPLPILYYSSVKQGHQLEYPYEGFCSSTDVYTDKSRVLLEKAIQNLEVITSDIENSCYQNEH